MDEGILLQNTKVILEKAQGKALKVMNKGLTESLVNPVAACIIAGSTYLGYLTNVFAVTAKGLPKELFKDVVEDLEELLDVLRRRRVVPGSVEELSVRCEILAAEFFLKQINNPPEEQEFFHQN